VNEMEINFSNYQWDSPRNSIPDESVLIKDLFCGLKDTPAWVDAQDVLEARSGRPRKFITEIFSGSADDQIYDDVPFDESDEEAVMETEEVFQILDDVIQDWKIKLECIVGDGLKKLRKAGKEKKLMIKYLPGEYSDSGRKLGAPKAAIMKDWKTDFTQIVNGIQKKLDRMTKDKVKEVDDLYSDKLLITNKSVKEAEDLNKNKKETITIDTRDNKSKDRTGNYTGLKQLIRELNKMCEKVANSNYMMNDPNMVPIYNMNNDNQRQNVVANTYETPLNQYLKYLMTLPAPTQAPNFQNVIDPAVIAKNQANILDTLEDFRLQQNTQNKLMKMKMKDIRRDNNRVSAQRKMLQRKVNRKGVKVAKQERKPDVKYSFRMKHYNKDGKDHYLIVKKSEPTEKVEVEDIFADWRACALDTIDDRKRQRTPRVRKLSHRAQRKEMLREDAIPQEGPLRYADILKKGLKFRPNNAPVEDIFEAWRDYLQELDDLLTTPPTSATSSRHTSGSDDSGIEIQNAKLDQIQENSENILETAVVYQKELQSCGQPTVRTVPCELSNERIKADMLKSFSTPVQVCEMPSKEYPGNYDLGGRFKKLDAKKRQKIMKFQPEIYFAGWRHNLNDASYGFGLRKSNKRAKYQTEEIFREWRRNFYVRERCELDEEKSEKRQRKQMQPKMMPEKIFNEWLHNFHFHNRPFSKAGSLRRRSSKKEKTPISIGDAQEAVEINMDEAFDDKSLKNKSRSNRQRRSKNKKR